MLELFSDPWAVEWCRRLNASPAYQAAAATWEGSIALVMEQGGSGGGQRAVFADLWHGECRGARPASGPDLESARYVLTGKAVAWRDVLTGRTAPLLAVMTGKLKLSRGSLGQLAPYATAARELVVAAMSIEAAFPEGWT